MFFARVMRAGLGSVCALLCLSASLLAQSERGTISGAVRDASGAVIPGARVTVTNTATNTSTTIGSNEAGEFTVPSLAVGNYTVRVDKEGFKPAEITGLTLNAASSARADVILEVGTAQQAIEVAANAVQLKTEDAKTSVTIQNKLVDELPLVVSGALRSPFDLAQLTPEAKSFGDQGFVLGGGQASSFGSSLDGVSTNTTRALQVSWVSSNAPSLEAITEFTVDTNGFKAEYGHSGGGVMTFSSKSGTNSLHGSAYEFLRNNDLDANRFFSNRAGVPRAIYKQHDFGASVGGPVYIPKLYHGRNKTFFFFAYEGFRNRAGATSYTTTVPTAEMYNGDFSNWVDKSGKQIQIYDPTTQTTDASGTVHRNPFPNNQIPKSLFSPFAVKALGVFQTSGILKPNNNSAPGTVGYINNNYTVSNGSQVSPVNKWSVKGDHIFSEKNRISGYYGYDRESQIPGPSGPATLPGLYTNYNDGIQATDVVRLSYDHTFSPTIFNHFYSGGNNWRQNHNPPQAYIGNWKDKICLLNAPDCNQNLINLGFTGYAGWGGPANNGSENTIYSFNNDTNWIKGKHSIKFGEAYQLSHYNGFGRQCISGCVGFDTKETGLPGVSDFTKGGGNAFASFLLGYADSGSLDTVRFIGQQWPYYAGYVQDDYRITSKLVLNLGLRWETTLPPTGLNNKWSDFSPTTPNPKAGGIPGALIYAGTGPGRQGSRTLADSYFKAFGPHVAFAYTWNDKTVVRASYARSYQAITTVTGSTHQRGFTQSLGFSNASQGIQPTFLLDQGLPDWPRPPFIDPSFANKDNIPWWQGKEATSPPVNDSMNFSIQRQLTSSLVLETSYNVLLGSHLQSGLLTYDQVNTKYLNQYGAAFLRLPFDSPQAIAAGIVAPYPTFKKDWKSNATVARALRPFPQYNGIDTASGGGDHSGHSTYHAAIVRLEKRYSSGLTFQTSYVFSKLLTDSDNYWPGAAAADFYNRGLEKSIGQFDITHNFKLGLVYDLPFGKGKQFLSHGFAAAILGNWRVSSINYYSSGAPVGIYTTVSQPIFAGRNVPYVTSYDGWRASYSGKFDPTVDNFFVPYGTGPFPLQGKGTDTPGRNGIGNATRYNPKVRYMPNYNENFSIAKSFPIHEQIRMDFRAEAFNALNRVRFGTGSQTLQDQNFGHLTGNGDLLNTPRQLQLGLKLYF